MEGIWRKTRKLNNGNQTLFYNVLKSFIKTTRKGETYRMENY